MTPSECVALCRYVRAAVPHQQWDASTPDVWFDLGLSEVPFADAKAAVQVMIRGKVFVDFTGIVAGAGKVRTHRLDGIDSYRSAFPGDPDDAHAELAWWRDCRRRVLDGETFDEVFDMPALISRTMPAVERTFRRPPRGDP